MRVKYLNGGRFYLTRNDIIRHDSLLLEIDFLRLHLIETITSYSKEEFKLLTELIMSKDKDNLLIALAIITKIPKKK